MLWPVGASFLLTIPVPCYCEAVNRIRLLHIARNILFAALALFCFALAIGWLSVSRLGLAP